MAGFHYEIYRPAATQPDWSTSLSCGLILDSDCGLVSHTSPSSETILDKVTGVLLVDAQMPVS